MRHVGRHVGCVVTHDRLKQLRINRGTFGRTLAHIGCTRHTVTL